MKKIKNKDTIAMLVVVALIIVYIFYECYSVTHIELRTQTVSAVNTVYDTIVADAIVVRDEYVVQNNGSAITVPAVSDGDKINVGGNVAYTFASAESANAYTRYNEIESELQYYENLESRTVGQAANVESINSKINDNVDEYIRSLYANSDVSANADAVNSTLIQRQLIIGENIDFSAVTQDLRKQTEKYASESGKAGFVTADRSGVFCAYTDGYENLIPYDKACEQSIDDVRNAIKNVKKSARKESNNIGKLITSYNWYLEMIVPADSVKSLKNGSFVTVALKDNNDTTLKMEIVDGAEPDYGTKETLLVLQCNDMNTGIASLRLEEVEIRYQSYDGIKVPAQALHVVDGKKGVFVLVSSQVQFRTAEVICSADDWVLLSYDKDDKDGIRMYDKIITQGKDLEDGKVYT